MPNTAQCSTCNALLQLWQMDSFPIHIHIPAPVLVPVQPARLGQRISLSRSNTIMHSVCPFQEYAGGSRACTMQSSHMS